MSCTCEHTVNRDGSGQLDRYLKALDPDYALIDDRDIKDLLVYAKRYAGQIRFYDLPEHHVPDNTPPKKVSWKEFFRRDVAVIAASIGSVDLHQIKKDYDETRIHLDEDPDAGILSALYKPILGMAVRLEKWLDILPPDNPLSRHMKLAIDSDLGQQLQKGKAIEEGYVTVDAGTDLDVDYSAIKKQGLWGLDQPIDPNLSVYEGTEEADKIRNAALYIDDVFLAFYGYLSGLVDKSEGYLLTALEEYPSHRPHMALFITFLKLFTLVQQQMNGITERMLNFYYRDVLQLQEKPSVPDKVHIIFELAKGVSEYRVIRETELDGGKDKSGSDQIYQTDDELVVNRAKVVELKTLFIDKGVEEIQTDEDSTPMAVSVVKGMYARPVANSVDGYGEPFEDEYPAWPTFGRGDRLNLAPKSICDEIENLKEEFYEKNETKIGFAVASPQLVLQGGNRLIQFKAKGLHQIFGEYGSNYEHPEQIQLTTEEGWLTIKNRMDSVSTSATSLQGAWGGKFDLTAVGNQSFYFVIDKASDNLPDELYIFLPIGEAAITAYDIEAHQHSFSTVHPIMQVLLGPRLSLKEEVIHSLKFDSSSIRVKVGSMNIDDTAYSPNMDGLSTIGLENDAGAIEPDKVFDPFTAYPNSGKSLYIGSNEIYNKPSPTLSINIQFSASDAESFEAGDIKFKLRLRKNGMWVTQKNASDEETFESTELDNGRFQWIDRKPLTNYQKYSSNAVKGFIQLQLQEPFAAFGTDSLFQDMQANAEMLKAKSIAISYESTLYLESGIDQIFHVYPFGVVETYLDRLTNNDEIQTENSQFLPIQGLKQFKEFDAARDNLVVYTDHLLLPQFSYTNPNTSMAGPKNGETGNSRSKTRPKNDSESVWQHMAYTASGLYDTVGVSFNQYFGDTQEEGLLYIGLEEVKPQQTLTMLFQFADGSAEDTDNDPPEIHWSYLSNNEWKPLKEINLISDGTYGFQTTGIVKIDVPKDATDNNTIVTTGLHWFRTSVTENSHRIPRLINVVAQAVVAKFEDRDNHSSHFECPLPAESIGKLKVKKAEVKSVMQPFASWNGKAKEVGKEFYIRVSERLRHKARAVNAWDYEHLVLDRFPSIYKVKALTHTDPNCLCRSNTLSHNPESVTLVRYNGDGQFEEAEKAKIEKLVDNPKTLKVEIKAFDPIGNTAFAKAVANRIKETFVANGFAAANVKVMVVSGGEQFTVEIKLSGTTTSHQSCCGPQVAPGHVMLVPITNLKSRNGIDPLRPKTSRRTLLEIEAYLKKRTSPFVKVHAKNPVYEQILVYFCVRFHLGIDKGFYLKQLNEEIVHYLTPWAFDGNADVSFDQKIYASSVINFIEERPYVDYIKDFLMGVCKAECCSESDRIEDVEEGSNEDENSMGGIIYDGNMDRVLPGVEVVVEGAPNRTSTTDDGRFQITFEEDEANLRIFHKGYETKIRRFGKGSFWKIRLYRVKLDGADSTCEDLADLPPEELFPRFCGCDDVEKLLAAVDFDGETVIRPSTNRSLLVSAPKHLIIPCEEETEPNPCEERKSKLRPKGTETTEHLLSSVRKNLSSGTIKGIAKPKVEDVSTKDTAKVGVTPEKKTRPKTTPSTKKTSKGKTPSKTTSEKKAASKIAKSGSTSKAKSATKKTTVKKPTAKKPATKSVAEKTTASKNPSAKKPASKATTKKTPQKKSPPKRTSPKKTPPKKDNSK